jgi:hypothetical protein
MPKYAPIAAAGAIAAAVLMTAAASTEANANAPGCRLPHLHPYVACTDSLRARMPTRQVFQGHRGRIAVPGPMFHRGAGFGFRRR